MSFSQLGVINLINKIIGRPVPSGSEILRPNLNLWVTRFLFSWLQQLSANHLVYFFSHHQLLVVGRTNYHISSCNDVRTFHGHLGTDAIDRPTFPFHLPAKACCARGLSRSAPGFTYLPYISPCFIIFLSACAWIFCLCYISYDQIQEPSLYVSLYVA